MGPGVTRKNKIKIREMRKCENAKMLKDKKNDEIRKDKKMEGTLRVKRQHTRVEKEHSKEQRASNCVALTEQQQLQHQYQYHGSNIPPLVRINGVLDRRTHPAAVA